MSKIYGRTDQGKKKSLSAKKYLEQLQELDININQDLEELQDMKINMCSLGSIDYSKDRVQSSPAGDTLCKGVVNYVMRDEEINAEIDRFTDAKKQIIKEIRGLHNANYIKILYKVYVQHKNLKVTAGEMHKSYQYVREVHKKALAEFKKTYKNLHYLA